MILHSLTIIIKELNSHLVRNYNLQTEEAVLGNLAEGFSTGTGTGGIPRDKLNLSIVNIKEEKTLKNTPNYVRNDITLKTVYENPPVFLNFQVLVAATHTDYQNALLMLSRTIQFFQYKNVFTQDNVSSNSIKMDPKRNELDQLEAFKLIFDLYSPTMEEVNHLWGTLGGKQYPFVLYTMRMLNLKFKAIKSEQGFITEVVNEFHQKKPERNQDV